MALIDVGDVQNLTALYSSQFKEVGNIELRLRAQSVRESADAELGVGYIESVDLERTTVDQAGVESVDHIIVPEPDP